jgi:hypothetical protein
MATFRFYTRLNLIELLGRRARTARELLEGLREVPGSSVYYHTHRFLQQHHYLSQEPPNDFAFWVTNSLSLDPIGERLASIDTVRFRSIRELQQALVEVLEASEKVRDLGAVVAPDGEEFHFMSARTFILPTPYEVASLEEFREALGKVTIDSIYFHMFEARLRLERGENDFSNWFEGVGQPQLAREISRLDPYTITLEGLRRTLIQKVSRYVHD